MATLMTKTIATAWIATLCLAAVADRSSEATAPEPTVPWNAPWIAPPGITSEPNSWWCFRKQVTLDESSTPCTARIACDSKYWLWVNGELLVSEGQLKRGPTPNDTYYDRVDLSEKLRLGDNTIAVLVWHFGKPGMSHKSSGQVGLLFDFENDRPIVGSDASWKVRRHPAYGTTGEPHPNWRLPESNVAFDARKDLSDWQAAAYDDSAWATATERGTAPSPPWNCLVQRPVPQWRQSYLRDYENTDTLPKISTGEPIVARLPYNAQVTPYLEVEADAGVLIDLRTDNHKGGSEPGVRAEYTTRFGIQKYESLGWMNGHSVIYTIPAGVRIHALKYRESGYDTDFAGSFICDDELLNTLWKKAQRTLYVNMRDTYFDCPGRERAQWWGDVTLELQQAFYALDRRSDALTRKGILELAAWAKPDGALHSPIPAGNYDAELPTQMLASIGRYGFWEYYRHTGDRATIETVYPAVNRYLDLWTVGDNGLLIDPRQGSWTWGDWGTNKDMPLLYNAWYYLAIDGRRQMAELLGDAPQAEADADTQRRLAEAFNAAFWTEDGYRSPEHDGPTDDRGNALAVVAGIAEPIQRETLVRVLTKQRHASPYLEKYVLEALIQLGEREAALDRMRERYATMIDSPITTLWEGWGIGAAGYGGGSYNHAWGGGPLTLLSQYFAGVDPITPGYDRYRIAPRLGSLNHLNAVVPSPKGTIEVRARQEKNAIEYTLSLPRGGEAEVVLPAAGSDRVLCNGIAATSAPTVSFGRVKSRDAKAITLLLEPGRHTVYVAPAAAERPILHNEPRE